MPAATPATFPAALFAALLAGALLTACGGGGGGGSGGGGGVGGGGSGGGNLRPPPAPTPTVTIPAPVSNDEAIDPTLAFRAVEPPTSANGFTIKKEVPSHPVPVVVIDRVDLPGVDAGQVPADLKAMTARAALLWTRRLTDRGTHHIDLRVGGTCAESNHIACARANEIILPKRYPSRAIDGSQPGNRMSNYYFGVILHEVGHTLSFFDPDNADDRAHATCNIPQLMCARLSRYQLLVPSEADFDGLGPHEDRPRNLLTSWTVGPPVADHQTFGLWAEPNGGGGGLDRFGITLTRTLKSERRGTAAADSITDTIAIRPRVDGAPGPGPASGSGTATWAGTFLGAQSRLFQPVTGSATLTAKLADLSRIDLSLSELIRTDDRDRTHSLDDVEYGLDRYGAVWVDAGRRADARFYAAGGDPAGTAAGIVNDDQRSLVGAWGAHRDRRQ